MSEITPEKCDGEMVDGRWFSCGYADCHICGAYTDGAL